MTPRERLIDHLRFGPMARMMLDWTEDLRMSLCEQMADDLLRSGWTQGPAQDQPQHHAGVWMLRPDGECGCECPLCWRDDKCRCQECTARFHDHSERAS